MTTFSAAEPRKLEETVKETTSRRWEIHRLIERGWDGFCDVSGGIGAIEVRGHLNHIRAEYPDDVFRCIEVVTREQRIARDF